jgi:hypothetical protein
MKDEAHHNCDSCGQDVLVPIDLTAGSGAASDDRPAGQT